MISVYYMDGIHYKKRWSDLPTVIYLFFDTDETMNNNYQINYN